jgi:Putative transposase/Transposase zinc-binding domain
VREHRLEIADVFRQHGKEFLEQWGSKLSLQQRKALRDIGACRTAALGGHVEECDHCARRVIAYNSCRNRHCPKCQSAARNEWLAERAKELLPVPYCHVVFTIPQQLAPLALQNQQVCYGLLFRAVSETLQEIAADSRHLGAKIGILAVLHTWSQNLLHHPHVHCLVPAGGLSRDRTRWIACRPNFFLPVRVLSRLFRGKLLAFLRQAFAEGSLKFCGRLADFAEAARFHAWLRESSKTEWVVYAKPPFGGPEDVLKYLARYTHRVAISSSRLLSLQNGQVTFRWRDSKHGNQIKVMTLDAIEFIRRFLLHVLPSGFVKIRHFGFLSNRNRRSMLALCRKHLNAASCAQTNMSILTHAQRSVLERRCLFCHVGTLRMIEWLSPEQMLNYAHDGSPMPIDSS